VRFFEVPLLHSRNGVVKFQSGPVSPPVSSRLVSSRNRNNVVIFDGESRSSKFLCPFIVNREDEARGYPESRSRSRIKPSRENERQAESSRKMREREREREREKCAIWPSIFLSANASLFGRLLSFRKSHRWPLYGFPQYRVALVKFRSGQRESCVRAGLP